MHINELGRTPRLSPPRILLLHHDAADGRALAAALEQGGLRVHLAAKGGVAAALNQTERVDLALVDLQLTEVSGFDVLSWFERTGCGIVALHGPERASDRILALELGADDVVSADCPASELVARIRAVHRRFSGRPTVERLAYGPINIDLARGTVMHMGERVKLTAAEMKVLELLATHNGHIVSRDTLSEAALRRPWRPEDRSVDQLVFSLRQKLPTQDANGALIQTVRCGGYRMRAPDAAPRVMARDREAELEMAF